MHTIIISTTIISSIVSPDYYDQQILETSSFTAYYTVEWWEQSDQFVYTLENDRESLSEITYWEVTGLFDFDYQIDPGSMKKIILFGDGFGYDYTTGFVFSEPSDDFVPFQTIYPIPSPGSLALLGLSLYTMGRKRRV